MAAVSVKKTGPTSQELSFSTAATPDAVYEYLSDFSRHAEWVSDIVAQEQTSPGAAGVGATFRTQEAMKGGMKAPTFAEIVALQRPSLIEWRAHTGATRGPLAMRSHWTFRIEPEGAGSRVTQVQEMEPPNVWARMLMAAFVPLADGLLGGTGASPKNVAKHMERLKEILDGKAAR